MKYSTSMPSSSSSMVGPTINFMTSSLPLPQIAEEPTTSLTEIEALSPTAETTTTKEVAATTTCTSTSNGNVAATATISASPEQRSKHSQLRSSNISTSSSYSNESEENYATSDETTATSEMLEDLTEEEQKSLATNLLSRGYDLCWNVQDYDQALEVLQKAMHIQRCVYGKHHVEIGYTCNFIGTTFWLKHELGPALRYFLESRRIFCKSGGRGKKVKKSVDERIDCILTQLGLDDEQIMHYQGTICRSMEHELLGDRLKQRGYKDQAKIQYRSARRLSTSLKSLMNE